MVFDKGEKIVPYYLDRTDIVDDDMSMMENATFVALYDTKRVAQAAIIELDGGQSYDVIPTPVEVEVLIDSKGKPVMTITMPISEALHQQLSKIKSSL